MGRVVEAWTRETRSAEPARDVISQAAPTDWMSPPKFEAKFDSHTARKIPCFSGAKGEEDLVKVFVVKTAASGRRAVGERLPDGWPPL
jgi:hypothetical protein